MDGKWKVWFILFITALTIASMTIINTIDFKTDSALTIQEEYEGKPEGTGYTFEDLGKGINLPVDEVVEPAPAKKESSIERTLKSVWKRRIYNSMREADQYDQELVKNNYSITPSIVNGEVAKRKESKGIIAKVQNNITLNDKLTLLKILKYLSVKDINDIKNAISEGTTNSESIKLWTMLRERLPREEYVKVERIIAKYE